MHTPDWRRRAWLALIGGAHLLAFICWQPPVRPLAARVLPHAAVTYILAPLSPPPPRVARVPERQLRSLVPARSRPQPVVTPRPITAEAPVNVEPAPPQAISQSAPPPDPFAVPVKPEQTLKERALQSAAAMDRQMRKDAWNPRDKKIANDETALAAAMGKAYRGGGVQKVEMVAPDGSRITKWIMPGGQAVCYYAEPNTFAAGRDPFRDSGRLSVRSCPN